MLCVALCVGSRRGDQTVYRLKPGGRSLKVAYPLTDVSHHSCMVRMNHVFLFIYLK